MRALLLLAALAAVGAAAYAQGDRDDAVQPEPPVDTESTWSVGIARFQGAELSPEDLYLAHTLPMLLKERLREIDVHFFGEEERTGYRRYLLLEAQRRLGESLQTLRQERDGLFFRDLLPGEREQKVAAYDQQIRRTVAQINGLREMSPAEVAFPDHKELRFTEGEEPVIDSTIISPLRLARQKGVNLLVWGSLEELQNDYLYLEVRALDSHLAREVFFYSDAALSQDLYGAIDELVQGLALTLRGRPWATLFVSAVPEGALVYLDGSYAGRAPLRLEYLSPGKRLLRVEAAGYSPRTLEVDLPEQGRVEETVELATESRPVLPLDTQPPGAAVYADALWVGRTPLAFTAPQSPTRVLFRLEGFPESVAYVSPKTREEPTVDLAGALADPAALQETLRNKFYNAFGVFALSVPLPFFFWAATNDFYTAYLKTPDVSERGRLADSVNTYYKAYLGTLGLSLGLFANLMVNLVRYVRSADRRI